MGPSDELPKWSTVPVWLDGSAIDKPTKMVVEPIHLLVTFTSFRGMISGWHVSLVIFFVATRSGGQMCRDQQVTCWGL